jgi:hypothetical protein
MFEIGKLYRFECHNLLEDVYQSFGATVIEVALPLIKVRMEQDGQKIVILNTSASTFISATPSA